MELAEKLIHQRKKAGWSQEELAGMMNVSRQSVSKWESAQSVPELDKIVRLSELFGVSIDYLLKVEKETDDAFPEEKSAKSLRNAEYEINTEHLQKENWEKKAQRKYFSKQMNNIEIKHRFVSIEEANTFLSVKTETSKVIALGVLLCILSPICLIVLGEVSESSYSMMPENIAGGIGMIIVITLVAIAVALFIFSGSKTSPYEYLEKEMFETESGVESMVREQRKEYKNTYTRYNIIGIGLCIMSLIPLFIGVILDEENDLLMALMLSITFVLVGIGVNLFIRGGIIWESYDKLLQEGDYTREKKHRSSDVSKVGVVYWSAVTALYVGYSLITNNWEISWIIWVIAGILITPILIITRAFAKRSAQ